MMPTSAVSRFRDVSDIEASKGACISIFAYARPDHLRRCLQSLARCPDLVCYPVFIFCDGPPETASEELCHRIVLTREVAAAFSDEFCAELIFSPINQGVRYAVPNGVSAILRRHAAVIVIEDDLEVSPHFLRYMGDAISAYAESSSVMSVSAYTWPTLEDEAAQTYFSHFSHYWGWATWRRAWKHFIDDGDALKSALLEQGLEERFNDYSVFPRSSMEILDLYRNGHMGIWDICWSASVLLQAGLCLYPGRSLVRNHGFDGSGEHCRAFANIDFSAQRISEVAVTVLRDPNPKEDDTSKRKHLLMRAILSP